MPVISVWALVVSLIVLALGLVYKVVEKTHALKLADKEADRLRSRLETLEEARKNEALSISSEVHSLNNTDNNGVSKSDENIVTTSNKKINESPQEVHTPSPIAPPEHQKEVSSKISSLSEALSLESVLKFLNDDDTTPLQKSMFVDRNGGSRITWCGRVRTIKKMWESNIDSDIIIALSPLNATQKLGEIATAVFPNTEALLLAQANQGDSIFIEGTLDFSEFAGNWSASLKDSRLIRVEKNAQQMHSSDR